MFYITVHDTSTKRKQEVMMFSFSADLILWTQSVSEPGPDELQQPQVRHIQVATFLGSGSVLDLVGVAPIRCSSPT